MRSWTRIGLLSLALVVLAGSVSLLTAQPPATPPIDEELLPPGAPPPLPPLPPGPPPLITPPNRAGSKPPPPSVPPVSPPLTPSPAGPPPAVIGAPPPPPAPKPDETKKDAPAIINVQVPAIAVIWFGDQRMTQTGTRRTFQSPALEPGKTFYYKMKVTWPTTPGQKDFETTQDVTVRAGQTTEIDFTPLMRAVPALGSNPPAPPVVASPPPARPGYPPRP